MVSGLWGWHFVLLLALLAVVAAVVFSVIVAIRRSRAQGTAAPVVQLALTISAAWAGLTLLGAILTTVFWFTPQTYPGFELRVRSYWPVSDAWASGQGLDVEGVPRIFGGFTDAQVTASGLSLSTRMLLAAGDLAGSLVTVSIALLVALACFRLIQGRPFAPEIARLSLVAAAICLVGGVASQVLHQLGGGSAAREVIAAGNAPESLIAAMGVSIDWWPVAAAVGLSAASVLFRFGSRLQRDTDLLV